MSSSSASSSTATTATTTTTTTEENTEEKKAAVVEVLPPPSSSDNDDDGGDGGDSGSSTANNKTKTTTTKNSNKSLLNRKNTNSSIGSSNSSNHTENSSSNNNKEKKIVSPKQNNTPTTKKKQQLKIEKRELKQQLKAKKREHKEKQEQGEQMLNDVLLELDRERSTRAELEARVRILEQDLYSTKKQLKQQQQQSQQQNHHSSSNDGDGGRGSTSTIPVVPTTKEFIRLQTEKDGYLQLLDAILQDRPAFQSAALSDNEEDSSEQQQTTLPLHVLRMMEIIPWDPRTKPHLFGEEQLYEWQIYSSGDKTWKKEIRHFPKDVKFKHMSWIIAQPNQTVNESPTSSSPPKGQNCVLTNLDVTRLLNIDNGYPLPRDGGVWKWVGGWRIEKNQNTDKLGWSYSNSILINDDNSYYGELRMPQPGQPNFIKRRRKWTRLRVLIDYPNASESTTQYLKLVATNAELDVSVDKLSSQLVETKMNLTTLEADHLTLKEDTDLKIRSLQRDIADKKRIIQLLGGSGNNGGDADNNNNPTTTSKAKESVNELKNAVTQWVTNTVSQQTNKQQQKQDNNDHNTVEDKNQHDNKNTKNAKNKEDEKVASSSSTTTREPAARAAALDSGNDSTTTTKPGSSNTTNSSSGGSTDSKQQQHHVVFVESLKEKGGDILGKGGDLFEIFKKKVGGAEKEDLIEKLKQSNKNFNHLKDILSPNKSSNKDMQQHPSSTTTTTTSGDDAGDGAKLEGSGQKSSVVNGVGGDHQSTAAAVATTTNKVPSSLSNAKNNPFTDDSKPAPIQKSTNPFDD